jgi:hypothetical protein
MSQKIQNYSNHSKLVPVYHFGIYPALIILMIGSIRLIVTGETGQLLPWLLLLFVITAIGMALYARSFALKAQDRAIRAEENLRYFMLTGKRMSQQVSLGQIIALRFASDEEFVDLVHKAINENLRSREIKKLVKNWRPDFHRV